MHRAVVTGVLVRGDVIVIFRQILLTLAGGLLFLAPVAWAQSSSDTEELDQGTAALEQSQEAAGQALDIEAIDEGPVVTYADVLRNPDDVDLNLRFARAQVNQGNVRGAAATLERILLVDPELAQVRLFYAVVLFRLENIDEAELEFQRVATLDIPADVRAEVERYLERIALARRMTRYTATLSLGMHYDTNRTATPRSETLLFINIPLDAGREEDDFGYLAVGSIRIDHDLGFQEKHEMFGSLTYYHDEQVTVDPLDLQSFILEGGGIYRGAFLGVDIVPSFSYTRIELSRQHFFQEWAMDVRFERRFSPGLDGFISGGMAQQRFHPINENGASPLRDGGVFNGMLGGSYVISSTMRISADYQFLHKNAVAKFFAYNRNQFRVTHTWLLGGGQFLLNNVSYQRDRYIVPDVAIRDITRHDDIIRYRITYGAPLGFIFGGGTLWEELEDITLTGSVERLRSSSNLANFDFNNWKSQALLTKTWRF